MTPLLLVNFLIFLNLSLTMCHEGSGLKESPEDGGDPGLGFVPSLVLFRNTP